MRIVWLDPFHGGSHAAVAQGYRQHSQHAIQLLTMTTAGGWRWRMRGAALSFARMFQEQPSLAEADLLVTTDMLDLATFLGLTRQQTAHLPCVVYFHENQLTYPIPTGRQRDLAFPWLNYTAALAADHVVFNSAFHRDIWLRELPGLPGRYHDYREMELLERLHTHSSVLYPGLDLNAFDQDGPALPAPPGPPIILWNSRWEYDKGPDEFFDALHTLEQAGIDFRVCIAGAHINPNEPAFEAARAWLGERVFWWGYAPDANAYRTLLRQCDIVVSTAIQEFFGIAILEAIYAGCVPVLPARLSYPELIPEALHGDYLYSETTPLAARLSATIRDLPVLRQRDLRPLAGRFRWQQQAPVYDALFAQVAGRDNDGQKDSTT